MPAIDPIDAAAVLDRYNERWPGAGDRLLHPGQHARFPEHAGERDYRLLQGYKRAGDVLVQQALGDVVDRPNLVFPILYNYRHYVELALKGLILEHGPFARVHLKRRNHRLTDLWQSFAAIAAFLNQPDRNEAFLAVAACVTELDSIDPGSTAFRYAHDIQGNLPALPRDGVDLLRLHDTMNGIENFFLAVDQEFTHRFEEAVDYERDAAADYANEAAREYERDDDEWW